MTNDPWQHRSENMQCASCMWFVGKGTGNHKIGRCRRHAPTMNGYPVVFRDDWCGDHKLDEMSRSLPEPNSVTVAPRVEQYKENIQELRGKHYNAP